MDYQVPGCDLCKKASRRSADSVLCRDCANAISRVMPLHIYEANHVNDRQAQLAQARLLIRAATSSNMTSESSLVDAPQGCGWIWF
jgi:hypothetical protein